MKQYLIFFICFPIFNFGQSIFSNTIDGVNPNESNPYTSGQIVDPNITVSGISRAIGMFGVNAHNRYDAKSWKVLNSDPDSFFEFTLTPNAHHKIDFVSFIYKGQTSTNGPTLFAFRSSVDGFTADIGSVIVAGSEVSLAMPIFQNVLSSITFRLYGWAAVAGTGAFSINDFEFNGIVSCITPETPVLPEIYLGCKSTFFEVNWPVSSNASSYFINVAFDADFINNLTGYENKELGNVLSKTVGGLAVGGNYYVRLQSANECAVSAYSNSIKVAPPETIYNGVWSNGIPDASKKARFSSDFNLNTNLEVCSCQIDPSVAVHVDSGVTLKLENGLDVQDSGSLTFENNASLIQSNNSPNINSGSIVYKRISQPMNNFDYTYWSSPVEGQTLKALVPNTLWDKCFSWGITNWVGENPGNEMEPPGKGYIIRTPKPGNYGGIYPENVVMPYSEAVQFVGIPNNGHYDLPINRAGFYNLIGNPYPSALSADAFLTANASQLEGTIYFWTHNTEISPIGYASADYVAYNFTGGIAIKKAAKNLGMNNTAPTGNIAAGQSFFALSKDTTTGSVVFDNNMRVSPIGAALDNSNFFKGTKSKTTAIEKNRVWLNLTNTGGAFKQMLVGYVTGATVGYDSAFDGESFNGNTYVDFYSINENKNLTIQGRGLPFDPKDQVSLGYRTTISGTFEISIDHAEGNLANQTIFVEDKLTNIIHNLKNGPYSFTTDKGMFNDRLVLRYDDKVQFETSLRNQTIDEKQEGLVVSVKNHKIKINSFGQTMESVTVYDLKGGLLYDAKQLNGNEFIIPSFNSSNQFLIVRIQLSDGKWETKEIVF